MVLRLRKGRKDPVKEVVAERFPERTLTGEGGESKRRHVRRGKLTRELVFLSVIRLRPIPRMNQHSS